MGSPGSERKWEKTVKYCVECTLNELQCDESNASQWTLPPNTALPVIIKKSNFREGWAKEDALITLWLLVSFSDQSDEKKEVLILWFFSDTTYLHKEHGSVFLSIE